MRYVNCTVTIRDPKIVNIEYEEKEGKTREREAELHSDPFAKLTVKRLNHWVDFAIKIQEETRGKRNPIERADLEVIGLNLYRILFGNPKIEECFKRAYQEFRKVYETQAAVSPEPDLRMRMRLVFEEGARDLAELPWEFLFIPGEGNDLEKGSFFVSEKTELILTRYVPPSPLIKDFLATPPKLERLKILVAVSSPVGDGLGEISPEDVQEVLSQIKEIRTADVKEIRNPTFDALSKSINEKDHLPHIFHLIGHGQPGELALVKDRNDPDYDEALDDPQPRWVTSEQFRALFNKHKPRLVFLHACKGAARTSQEGFNSIVRELVYAEIPAVVAMQYSISNKDAGLFARTFYEELAKGRDIDEAVREGRSKLGGSYPPWGHPRFGTPVVILQTEQAGAVVLSSPEQEKEERKQVTVTGEVSSKGVRVGSSVAGLGGGAGAGSEIQQPAQSGSQPDRSEFKG